MQINNLENVSPQQLSQEIINGGRFVVFEYCISLLILTIKRGSGIYYIPPGEGTAGKSYIFTLISILLGWWGVPWGPIHTIGALYTNFKGGKDVTMEVMNALDGKSESTTLI